MAVVYVIPCIDTEGPAFDPKLNLLSTWEEVERSFHAAASPKFRHRFLDSWQNPVVLSWFIMDWTGFKTNPVQREIGPHKIFDRYCAWLKDFPQDGIFWHYHHPPIDGVGNHWNTNWTNGEDDRTGYEYDRILARRIIQRHWFPCTFRAGGTIEDNAASQWLDEIIPFDFSNRAPMIGDVFNWSLAPALWQVYSPSEENYQLPGGMRRKIARSLDVLTRLHPIGQDDVDQAFLEAQKGGKAILSFFLHDYRPLADSFSAVFKLIQSSARRYKNVNWCNITADRAMRAYLGYPESVEPGIHLKLSPVDVRNWLIEANSPIFGAEPFTAVELASGECIRSRNIKKIDSLQWLVTLPSNYSITQLGVAANSPEGYSTVSTIMVK
jgi:hypothetical protein